MGHMTNLTFINVEHSLTRINQFRLRAPGKTATNDARNGTNHALVLPFCDVFAPT
jgi:hypothetical protein